MLKKSQVQQIFIYIVAIILFSLILVYGYNAIKNFRSKTDQVALLQLKNDISSSITKVSTDFGTIIKKELDVPFKYKEICFVDLTKAALAEFTDMCGVNGNSLVCDGWKSNSPYNMFLISQKETETYNIGETRIDDPFFFCTNVTNGKAIIRLEGKGDYVLLSNW